MLPIGAVIAAKQINIQTVLPPAEPARTTVKGKT